MMCALVDYLLCKNLKRALNLTPSSREGPALVNGSVVRRLRDAKRFGGRLRRGPAEPRYVSFNAMRVGARRCLFSSRPTNRRSAFTALSVVSPVGTGCRIVGPKLHAAGRTDDALST